MKVEHYHIVEFSRENDQDEYESRAIPTLEKAKLALAEHIFGYKWDSVPVEKVSESVYIVDDTLYVIIVECIGDCHA